MKDLQEFYYNHTCTNHTNLKTIINTFIDLYKNPFKYLKDDTKIDSSGFTMKHLAKYYIQNKNFIITIEATSKYYTNIYPCKAIDQDTIKRTITIFKESIKISKAMKRS